MKMKLTVLLLGLATCGLVSCFAQDNNTNPANPVPADTAPAKPAPPDAAPASPAPVTPAPTNAVPADAASTNAAPVVPTAAAPTQLAQAQAAAPAADQPKADAAPPPPNANEPVPLIVIDEVPLTDAIRNLARQSNLNIQFDPRITSTNQPNVSIRFENVTAQEALTAVLDNYNLALVKDPKAKIARITIKDPKAEDPLVSRTIQLKYSEPTNMVTLVKPTLSARSQVIPDARTSQLIVTTTEKELDGLMSLVEKLDTATRQVLIEAKLLETSKNPQSVKGIDWSGTLAAQNFQIGNGSTFQLPPTPPTITPNPPGPPNVTPGFPGTLSGVLGTPKVLANLSHGPFFNPSTAFLNADGVSAVLSFLNTEADTEVLSTPRAVTLDNQTATIAVTKAFPIFQVTPGSANSPAGSTVIYTNLGTILKVTPRIAADKNISLRVTPEVSNIDSKDSQQINGFLNTANVYAIRRIDTWVMIPSGNTLVMGGLISDTKSKGYTKIPLLGDIPFVGLAFRHESKTRNKQNLLIFITPTIVEDEAFHITSSGSDFLKNQSTESSDERENDWDSAKPHDWSKPLQ
jgi:type II secretory pathway component GspD/PulD (secretin)